MKLEVDNNPGHLEAMARTIQRIRTWISGFNVGRGNAPTELSGFELHLGQAQILLTDLAQQAEKAASAKTTKRS